MILNQKFNLITLNLYHMRIFTKFFMLLILLLSISEMNAQERYLNEVFDKVNVSEQITVQSNFTVMPSHTGLGDAHASALIYPPT